MAGLIDGVDILPPFSLTSELFSLVKHPRVWEVNL